MGRYSRVWNGGFQTFTARPAGNPLAPQCRPHHPRFVKTTPYSPSSHYVFLSTYTCQIPTGYVFLSTYTLDFEMGGPPRSGMVVCRPLRSSAGNPWHPPMQTSPFALYADKTPNSFLKSYVFLSTYTSLIPGWGGTPGSGMVVSRPLRRGLPTPYSPSTIMFYLPPTLPGFRDGEGLQGLEWWFAGLYGAPCRKPLAPPNADLADKTPQLFSSRIPMGRRSKAWNGVFQAFTVRPAGNP